MQKSKRFGMDVLLVFSEQEIDQLREDVINMLRTDHKMTFMKLSAEIGISRWTLTKFLYKSKTNRNGQTKTIAAIKKYVDSKKK